MGILNSLKRSWRESTTAEKLNLVLDIICGFGAGAVGGRAMKKLAPGMNKVEKFCTGILIGGLELSAASAAVKAFEPYTDSLGKVVDTAKAKAKAAEKKEDESDGRDE